ncbi:MAG TPA: ABC transporter permease [Thermoanaerobaculia bacterium]|nr:ABC transporter permease [Thermoanaerobaculia bacterium]
MPERRASLWLGVVLVALLGLAGLLAPWLAPHPPDAQYDAAAAGHRPPGTSLTGLELADGRWVLGDQLERTAEGYRLRRLGELRTITTAELAPGGGPHRFLFPLGTDGVGRDLLSRLLHGARVSLALALLAVALAMTLGVLYGAIAATSKPWLDNLMMRLVDALLAFPPLLLMLTLAALFRPSSALLALVLGGTGWMEVSRLVRAQVKGVAARELITAARASGLSRWRILTRHLLPNSLTPVFALAPLWVANVILAESALSFLGLGIQPPDASWGTIINDGQEVLVQAWWIAAFPGLAIALAVIGWNLIGEALRELLDPRGGDGRRNMGDAHR